MSKNNITDKILRQLKPQKLTPVGTDLFLPNHSGDHSFGIVRDVPTAGVDIVNKTYADTKQSELVNSAGLAAALNDETGTGLAVFNTNPVLTAPTMETPILWTP